MFMSPIFKAGCPIFGNPDAAHFRNGRAQSTDVFSQNSQSTAQEARDFSRREECARHCLRRGCLNAVHNDTYDSRS